MAPEERDAPGVRRPTRLLWIAALLAGLIAVLLAASMTTDAAPFGFDRVILLFFRTPGDPAQTVGPGWVRHAMIALTAMGDGTILTTVVAVVAGLLMVRRLWLTAALVIVATASGALLAAQAKFWFLRPRPEIVPHLVDVGGLSFPSGHATNSAIVYLTLAGLVSQVEHGRAVRRYLLIVATLLVGAIGISRVFLGVHWPSDVLAGWSFGTLWALAWWWIAARLRRGRPSLTKG
jgi:undecaprenyl-diphosphatase